VIQPKKAAVSSQRQTALLQNRRVEFVLAEFRVKPSRAKQVVEPNPSRLEMEEYLLRPRTEEPGVARVPAVHTSIPERSNLEEVALDSTSPLEATPGV
jgi:hypothetical protein